MNGLRRIFGSGRLAVGMLIGMPTPTIVDIAGFAGLDYVVLDTEHCSYDLEVLENMASAAKARGVATLARLYGPDPYMIAKVLDIGVDGVKFSKVETRNEAEQIVSFCRFPPHGERSPEPATRSAGYGLMPREEYDQAARDVVVVVGVDTRKGVENVDEIVTVSGVDAVQCGPSDLSWSLGVNRDSDEFIEAVQLVASRARAAGTVPIRVVYTPGQIADWLRRDPELRVFHWAADRLNIARHFQEGVAHARETEKELIKATDIQQKDGR